MISCAKEVLTGTNWTGKTFFVASQGATTKQMGFGREAAINLSMLDAAVMQVAVLVAMCDLSNAFWGT